MKFLNRKGLIQIVVLVVVPAIISTLEPFEGPYVTAG